MSGLRGLTGIEFHKRGPAAAKTLSPLLLSVGGTTQAGTSADGREHRVCWIDARASKHLQS